MACAIDSESFSVCSPGLGVAHFEALALRTSVSTKQSSFLLKSPAELKKQFGEDTLLSEALEFNKKLPDLIGVLRSATRNLLAMQAARSKMG